MTTTDEERPMLAEDMAGRVLDLAQRLRWRVAREVLAPARITIAQWSVLVEIAGINPAEVELGRGLAPEPERSEAVIEQLVKAGFVQRRIVAGSATYQVTGKGQRLVQRLGPAVRESTSRDFRRLTTWELLALDGELTRCEQRAAAAPRRRTPPTSVPYPTSRRTIS